jgi:FkbM family methyltransferase
MELLDPKNLFSLIDELNIPEIYKLRSLQNFLHHYKIQPKTILDLGARDLYESIWFSVKYPGAKVHSFECNPDMVPLCQTRSQYFLNIAFNAAAVGSREDVVTFYKVDQDATKSQSNLPYYIQKDGNPGASSLFLSADKTYKQTPVEVPLVRLDGYLEKKSISEIDILWMDIQGAELDALKGLGDYINLTKMIHTEVPIGGNTEYKGAPTFNELNEYLVEKGFEVVGKGQMDLIYLNKNIVW